MKIRLLFLLAALLSSSCLAQEAAPAPATGKIALAPLGDSRTAIIAFDAGRQNQTTLSHLNWANALNEQRYPYTGVFGISGADSDKIIAEMLAPALASHPTHMVILMGVNDVRVPGFSAEHTMANIAKAADAALEQGIVPIVCTDPGSEKYIAAQVKFINDLNVRIKEYCARVKGAVLFDMAELISTQREPNITFQPEWTYDGLHLQTLGAYKIGMAFAALMNSLGAAAQPYPGLEGNLLANPTLAGSGGVIGDGNTGELPDSYTGSRDNANCAVAFSAKARADGGNEIAAELATTDENKLAGLRISQTVPAEDVAPGEGFQAGVRADIEPGSVNLVDVRAEVSVVYADGSFAIVYDFDGTSKRDTISSISSPDGLALTLQTPAFRLPSDKQVKSVKFVMGARIQGKGRATIRYRDPWCRKVVSKANLAP